MRIDHVFAMLLATWAVMLLLGWAVVKKINFMNERLDQHSIKLEMLMDVKQNKAAR